MCVMINWREPEIKDKELLDSCMQTPGSRESDYGFATMYMWRHAYTPLIAVESDCLLVKMPQWNVYAYPKPIASTYNAESMPSRTMQNCDSRKATSTAPISARGSAELNPGHTDSQEEEVCNCKLDSRISNAIEDLADEAHSLGCKLLLRGLTDDTLPGFLAAYGDRFDITEDRDNADYIYTADKLCNLPGRHLASKRNHINKFERTGDWELRPLISDTALDEALAFVSLFFHEKNDPELVSEARAIEEMFEHYDELGVYSALLYQNGKPVAWSAGTALNSRVFDVHFEKALASAEGAYAMINREFARMIVREIPTIELFNREEDMGLEGLRRAKLSYHPDELLMKYYAREK